VEYHCRPERAVTGFWRLYATRQRGWIALACLVLCVFLRGFFIHPAFAYRSDSPHNVCDLQLAFTAERFREVLSSWANLEAFKSSLWMIDFAFPLAYAALLAFGYAWSRGKAAPTRFDRSLFLAPFVAALFDWGENGLHLYLLRGVKSGADAVVAHFPEELVVAASTFAIVKFALAGLVAVVTLVVLIWGIFRQLRCVMALLPYAYLLRFPLLSAVGLVMLAYVSLLTSARPLLAGLFDLTAVGVFWATLAAFLVAWTVMATWRLVLLYGSRRFKVVDAGVRETFGWDYQVRHGLLALPVVVGAVWMSPAPLWQGGLGALLGLAASLAALWGATYLQHLFLRPHAAQATVDLLLPSPRPGGSRLLAWVNHVDPAPRLSEWMAAKLKWLPPYLGRGYRDYASGGVLSGHGLALSLAVTALLLYALIGLMKYAWLGESFSIRWLAWLALPSLAYVLLLLQLLCLGLSALSFFLDRYRIPVLIPLALWLILTAQSPRSDHYYHVTENVPGVRPVPAEELRAGGQEAVVVVAASGGGIQAAAWTARVLTGLEQQSRQHALEFGRRVRLISSVSGGSTGTMYVVQAYEGGALPDDAGLERVVGQAQASSLDEVAWGLVYPDLLRSFFLAPFGVHMDRGLALEEAWRRHGDIQATLAGWREDARRGQRPGVIFNATIADTGQRLLFATADLHPNRRGGQTFSQLYPQVDLSVVTAARLSATFPYVTPAARADLGSPATPQYHVVDGGYYDNYGVSSLAEWLSEALEQGSTQVKRVLIVQIRDSPVGQQSNPKTQRGWFYQTFAPVATLLHVRSAGQYSHNEVELGLLRQVLGRKCIVVEDAEFEFPGTDAPLSWHLTEAQKRQISERWERMKNGAQWEKVRRFLSGQPPSADPCQAP
jgi:Patatin-like phospholipase